MKAFKYTFQKIVDLKESEKTQAEWMLSEAIAELNEQQKQLEHLENQEKVWQQKLEDSVLVPTTMQDVITIQHYIDFYIQAIVQKKLVIQKVKQKVDMRRQELASKMKEEKVWVKAKDNAYSQFKQAVQLKEQNELDEMASIRFIAPTP